MLILIGSTAARSYISSWREPNDRDCFSNQSFDDPRIDAFWHPDLLKYFGLHEVRRATIDELYTIKVSHSFWELQNGSWGKHMKDQLALKEHGAQFIPELYDILYGIWARKHGDKRLLNLDQESKDFFKDAVKRIYDHDSIHKTVAFGDTPLYESILKDGSDVAVSSKKLWALDDDERVKLFREEIYATALERLLIPSDYKMSAAGAYMWALRRTMTSLTKGKSALYLSLNFERFADPFEDDYLARHYNKIDKLIKLEEGETVA